MESLFGTRPVVGGRHPAFGTHNALLSLGPSTYLEVIAPDPEVPPPERGLVFAMDGIAEPRLATWALRREELEGASAAASAAGVPLGAIQSGFRDRADGVRLDWRLTDPHAMPLQGVVPFVMAWGDTPHPAEAAPQVGTLEGLTLRHPEAQRLRGVLEALGVEVRGEAGVPADGSAVGSDVGSVLVSQGPTGLSARIRTAEGVVEL